MWGLEISIMLSMIAMNSVFAGYEIALASVSLARLQILVQDKQSGAKPALYMKENMEASLAVVQLGITFVGAIAAATGGAGAEENLAPMLRERLDLSKNASELLAIIFVVLPLTMVTIIFGELIPKVFALRNKEWLCLKLSPAMRWFSFSVWPVVWMLETVVTGIMNWGERRWQSSGMNSSQKESTEISELRAMAGLARALQLIGSRQERIIHGAATLSDRPVRDILLPAEHISMLNVQDSLTDCLIAAHLHMHTRFPVAEKANDPQTIIGYVNFKDLVALMRFAPQEPFLRGIVRPLPSLKEDMPIAHCLETMIRDHTHVALIRNDENKVLGMITLEDILEELVGDIQDEFDRLPSHIAPSGAGWIVGGGLLLTRFKEITGIDLNGSSTEPKRVTDWIISHLSRPVRGGDILEREGIRVVIRKVRRSQVLEAQISRSGHPTQPPV